MDKYLAQTQGLLGIVQATMSEEEFDRSAEASEKIYEAIKQVAEEYELNVHEMFHATLACNLAILEVINEEINQKGTDDNE